MKKALIALGIVVLGLAGVYAIGSSYPSGESEGDVSVLGSDIETEEMPKAVYNKVSVAKAKSMMDEVDNLTLLDVRTEAEFNESRIKGAVLIPDYEIEERVGSELPDKNALILVYCRSGGRSAGAVNKMVEMGYTNVYDMGGIIYWPYGTTSGSVTLNN
jgi:rhodanese-related sulfurtransferase